MCIGTKIKDVKNVAININEYYYLITTIIRITSPRQTTNLIFIIIVTPTYILDIATAIIGIAIETIRSTAIGPHAQVQFGNFGLDIINAVAVDPPLGLFVVASFNVVCVVVGGEGAVDFGFRSVGEFSEFEGLAVGREGEG